MFLAAASVFIFSGLRTIIYTPLSIAFHAVSFVAKGIEYPVGGFYEKYQNNFASWAVAKHEEGTNTDKIRQWFDKHCQ